MKREIRIVSVEFEQRRVQVPGEHGPGHGHGGGGGGHGPVNKILVAGSGSYGFTGTAATLSRTTLYRLVAGAASYLFGGTDATLVRAVIPKRVVAGSTSYALQGTAATLAPTFPSITMVAGSASYLFGGRDATLAKTVLVPKTLVAGSASYALNGSPASLTRTNTSKLLAAASATYVFTGSTATRFLNGRRVVAGGGSYAFSGTPAVIAKSLKKIDAGTAAYVFAGTSAILKRGKKLAAATASYAFSGTNNTFKRGKRLIANNAGYTFSGSTATLLSTNSTALTPLNMLGQQVHYAWFQENLPTGAVASWASVGRSAQTMTQTTIARQPNKLASNGGVHFPAGTIRFLQSPNNLEAPHSHRWWVVIARADLTAASGSGPQVLAINGTNAAQACRQPAVSFTNSTNVMNSFLFDTVTRVISGACDPDFADWNILIGWRRGAKHYARINGSATQSTDFLGFRVNNITSICTIGDGVAAMPVDMAVDAIVIGDGELTDYQVEVLEGWAHHRVGKQAYLTLGMSGAAHAFASSAPTTASFGPANLHSVFQFNQAVWDAFVATVDPNKYAHRGENTYSETGYSRVFFTDFDLVDQKPVSDLTGAANSPWFAPGWLTTLGLQASLVSSSGGPWPLAYVQNTSSTAGGVGRPGTLAFHMYNDGSWKTGAMYSVNNNGYGRTWGKGIFKVRCKFTGVPTIGSPYPGFFPAPLWAYAVEHLFQRTRNRIEPDFIELTGKDQSWNDATIHVHEPKIQYPSDTTIRPTAISKKVNGFQVKTSVDPDFAADLNVFDGNFHIWTCKIEDDFTYYWVDGEERGRHETYAAFLKPKYLISNFALDAAHGDRTPATTEVFDMTIDYVEVLQKTTDLAVVPTGFSGLPTIGGTTTVGSTLTATANTVGTQIEYRWYRDGVPIVTPTGTTYQLVAADSGHKIRVDVTNKSLVNQPHAWSGETATVTASGGGFPDASNTGHSGSLTAVPGSITSGTGWAWNSADEAIYVTLAGATLASLDVSGVIVVSAANVTISNCKITSDSFWGVEVEAAGCIVEDCTITSNVGFGTTAVNVEVGTCIIRRNDISNFENGVQLSGRCTITDNWFHDPVDYSSGPDPHTDGIQFLGTNSADFTLIEHNSILMNEGGGDTSAIILNATGHSRNVTVNNNRMRGAGFTVYFWLETSNSLTNNRIAGATYDYYTLEGGTGSPTVSGNVDDDTSAPI